MQTFTRDGNLHISLLLCVYAKMSAPVQSVVAIGILYKLRLKDFLLGIWIAPSYWSTPSLLLSASAVSDRVDVFL